MRVFVVVFFAVAIMGGILMMIPSFREEVLTAASRYLGSPNTRRGLVSGGRPPAPKVVSVKYQNQGFSPAIVKIWVGDTIMFENDGSGGMWPASNIHPTHAIYPEFDANKEYYPGESYSFIFVKPGKWRYHNHLDPNHKGTVEVE